MNATAVFPFAFEENQVRALLIDRCPWFVASDIAGVLLYRNAPDMTRNLDDDETGTHILRIRSENGVEQDREVTIINESGLYSAILRSRKPEAKRFKKWVTAEVLPSIRKTGMYASSAAQPIYPAAHPPLTEDLAAARDAMLDVAALVGMVQRSLSAVPVAGDAVRSLNAGRFLLEQFANTLDGVLAAHPSEKPVYAPAAPASARTAPPCPAPAPAAAPAAVDAPVQAEPPINPAPALLPAVTAPAPRVRLSAAAMRAAEIGQFVQAWREGRIVAPSGAALPYVPVLIADVFSAFVCWRNQQGMKPPMGDCRNGLLHPFKEHGLIMKGQWVARTQRTVFYPGGNRKPPEGQRMNAWLAESVAEFQEVAAELFGVGSVSHEPPADPA
jgi:hypothetical protein